MCRFFVTICKNMQKLSLWRGNCFSSGKSCVIIKDSSCVPAGGIWEPALKGEFDVNDKHLHEQLERALDKLSLPVELVSREDVMKTCSLSVEEERKLSENAPKVYGRMMYLYLPAAKAYLRCNAQHPGAKDLLLLASELATAYDNMPYAAGRAGRQRTGGPGS